MSMVLRINIIFYNPYYPVCKCIHSKNEGCSQHHCFIKASVASIAFRNLVSQSPSMVM